MSTSRETDRQTDRQIDRQTDRHIDRETDRVIERESLWPEEKWNIIYSLVPTVNIKGSQNEKNMWRKDKYILKRQEKKSCDKNEEKNAKSYTI